jgi:hypothetical protein
VIKWREYARKLAKRYSLISRIMSTTLTFKSLAKPQQ